MNSLISVKRVRYDLIHMVIVWQMCKKRFILAKTKTISEVKGSTKKIYQQKGLGRARHGSIRAAQFKGGGIIFGPSRSKVYYFCINKSIKKLSLVHALYLKFYTNTIKIVECITSDIFDLRKYNISNKNQKVLFVDKYFCKMSLKLASNIFNIKLLRLTGLNTLDIVQSDIIYFSKYSFDTIINIFRN